MKQNFGEERKKKRLKILIALEKKAFYEKCNRLELNINTLNIKTKVSGKTQEKFFEIMYM